MNIKTVEDYIPVLKDLYEIMSIRCDSLPEKWYTSSQRQDFFESNQRSLSLKYLILEEIEAYRAAGWIIEL